jgi:uncharacterized protein YjbJ (UPF0337 family)
MESSQEEREEAGQAQQVADQAREKVGEAADQAREKAQGMASQAQERIREQVDQRSTEAGERVGGTAQDIRSVAGELRNQGKEGPAKVAEQAAERIDRAGNYLRDSDSDRILSDVEDFGRSNPWAVLAGAVVVGFAAARFLKASSRERYAIRQGGEGTRPARGLPSAAASGVGSTPQTEPTQVPAGVR